MTAAASVAMGIVRATSGNAVRAKEVFLRRSVASGMMKEMVEAKYPSLVEVEDRRDGGSPFYRRLSVVPSRLRCGVVISCDFGFFGKLRFLLESTTEMALGDHQSPS